MVVMVVKMVRLVGIMGIVVGKVVGREAQLCQDNGNGKKDCLGYTRLATV